MTTEMTTQCDTCGRDATSWWCAGGRMLYACRDCGPETETWAHRLSVYPDGPHPLEEEE